MKVEPTLIIVGGELNGQSFRLAPDRKLIIGRDEAADISLREKKVSRKHASVIWQQARNEIILEDLESLNGTYVNGINLRGSRSLFAGDRIQIGSFLLEVRSNVPALSNDSENSSTGLRAKEKLLEKLYEESGSIRSLHPTQNEPTITRTVASDEDDHDVSVEESTGGLLITGKLQELGLADVLQMLAATRKSGRLVISKKRVTSNEIPFSLPASEICSIYLLDGQILHAQFGALENEEAIYALLRWTTGYFALLNHKHFEFTSRMNIPMEALLLEGFRRMDEDIARKPKLKPDHIFEVNLDAPLSALSPEELDAFQKAWKYRKFSRVAKNSASNAEKVHDLLLTLIQKGYLKVEE